MKMQLVKEIAAQKGLIVYGNDLRFKVWNTYMEKLTGLAAVDVVGKHPLEMFPFLRESGVMESLIKTSAGGIAEPLEFPYNIQKTGMMGWSSHSYIPLRNIRGDIIGVIVTVSDITELKKLEEALCEGGEHSGNMAEASIQRRLNRGYNDWES